MFDKIMFKSILGIRCSKKLRADQKQRSPHQDFIMHEGVGDQEIVYIDTDLLTTKCPLDYQKDRKVEQTNTSTSLCESDIIISQFQTGNFLLHQALFLFHSFQDSVFTFMNHSLIIHGKEPSSC